jgi:uncharacterized lipoprotein YajG
MTVSALHFSRGLALALVASTALLAGCGPTPVTTSTTTTEQTTTKPLFPPAVSSTTTTTDTQQLPQ